MVDRAEIIPHNNHPLGLFAIDYKIVYPDYISGVYITIAVGIAGFLGQDVLGVGTEINCFYVVELVPDVGS